MSLITLFSCGSVRDLPTVASVDLSRYAGTWYEIAKLPNRFEKGLTCITATYTLQENGKVEVWNKGYLKNDKGTFKDIKGVAWVPDKNFPGRLKVSFFRPFAGNYYIIALDEDYTYALVGDPSRKYLWVLSKNKTLDESVYSDLLQIAQELGFKTAEVQRVEQNCD